MRIRQKLFGGEKKIPTLRNSIYPEQTVTWIEVVQATLLEHSPQLWSVCNLNDMDLGEERLKICIPFFKTLIPNFVTYYSATTVYMSHQKSLVDNHTLVADILLHQEIWFQMSVIFQMCSEFSNCQSVKGKPNILLHAKLCLS